MVQANCNLECVIPKHGSKSSLYHQCPSSQALAGTVGREEWVWVTSTSSLLAFWLELNGSPVTHTPIGIQYSTTRPIIRANKTISTLEVLRTNLCRDANKYTPFYRRRGGLMVQI